MRAARLSTNIQISLILFLLGMWAVPAPLATAQDDTLTGWFTFIVADYPSEDGLVSETTYILTEDSGARHELLIDIDLMRPLGGPVALNRKRVTVEGEWEQSGATTEKFRVSSIELAVSPDESSALEASPDGAAALHTTSQAAVTGSQAWVTILCRFGDAAHITPHPVSHYEKLMGRAYPGLDHYWNEVSDGNIPDLRGSRVVGWYNLPRSRSYYFYIDEHGDEEFESERAIEDCTAVADADVFFPDFDGINLVFNNGDNENNGPSLGGSYLLTLDGQTRFWGVTRIHPKHAETAYHHVVAHEMGHALGLLHSSGPYGQDDPLYSPTTYDSEWDVMSGGQSLAPYPGGYGHLGVHTIAYHKDFLGWVPPDRKYVAAPNTTRTITLERLAQPGAEGYLLAQIPIGDSSTDFYTVETRRFAGYDDEIPDEAVIIHKVDTTREDRLAQVVDLDNNGDPNDAGAMWTPGEIFTDAENNLQVSIDAAWSTSFRVTINTNPATFTTCIDFLSASRYLLSPGWDSASVEVKAASDCDWSATSNTEWIHVKSGSNSSGPGIVSYAVTANPNPTTRTGTLTVGGWTVTVTQASTHNIFFADDLESGTEGWWGDSSWALTTASSRSGSWAWTDSPGGHYQNDLNVSSLSPVINLTRVTSSTLTFWHRYDFGLGDEGNVWVARYGEREGQEGWWFQGAPLHTFSGIQTTWQQVSLDLSPFVGERIRLGFQILSDASETADGWYIDDVVVSSSDSVAYDVCTHAVSPDRQVFGPREGISSVEVEAPRGCHWRAKSNSPWLRVTEGISGSGTGRVIYSFAANPNSTARTATLTVAGRTVRVIQARVKEVLFEDNMESGTEGWTESSCEPRPCSNGSPWALTTTSSRSGTSAWTDSPRGKYRNDQNVILWSPVIDLTDFASATLTFWHRYAFASGDEGNVWVARQREDGAWEAEGRVGRFTGTQPNWQQASLDLSPFVGERILLAFGLWSDSTETADGWYIDDVAVFSTDFVSPVTLENPRAGSLQSGIAAISGWACEAQEVTIELNGVPYRAGYGTTRTDTQDRCGDSDNGFSLLWNWNNLGPGTHTVRALLDGVEFAHTTVQVTTFGQKFLRDVSGTFPLSNFPHAGDTTTVQWEESLQNFVITAGSPASGGGHAGVAGANALLENPSLGSAQSGIAAISGWACEAEEIVIELNGVPYRAGYGTTRPDTQDHCGDADNGFSLLWNWNNLGPGTHTVRALADGVEFANTTVRVTTFGEPFRRGLSGTFPIPDFPRSGENKRLRWEESLQNFVIIP